MVAGIETFRRYFEEDEDKYVLIGGAACDIVFSDNVSLDIIYAKNVNLNLGEEISKTEVYYSFGDKNE